MKKAKTNATIILFMIFILMLPIAYSNGGCIKIADDIFVQITIAPHVPLVGEKASFLFSFGNKDGLIITDINGKIKIVQNDKVWLENEFIAKDGILDLKHEFKNAGLYEIFIDFELQNKTYSPEDFVIEVTEGNKPNYLNYFAFLILGFLIGILSAKLLKDKNEK